MENALALHGRAYFLLRPLYHHGIDLFSEAKHLLANTSILVSGFILPSDTTSSFLETSMPATCFSGFIICLSLNCSSDNLSSFLLLIGYADYTGLLYDLHSVQTLKGKKEEAVSFLEYTQWLFVAKSALTLFT